MEDLRDTHTRVALPYLRVWRQRAGLSRRELAQRAHVGESTIARVEMAAGRTNLMALSRLATGLGISQEQLRRDPVRLVHRQPTREDPPA